VRNGVIKYLLDGKEWLGVFLLYSYFSHRSHFYPHWFTFSFLLRSALLWLMLLSVHDIKSYSYLWTCLGDLAWCTLQLSSYQHGLDSFSGCAI